MIAPADTAAVFRNFRLEDSIFIIAGVLQVKNKVNIRHGSATNWQE
jgi:hypothetical protein